MLKHGDKVQFSGRLGERGLIGFVCGFKHGWVLVQWKPNDRQWVRPENLEQLPNSTRRVGQDDMKEARDILRVAREILALRIVVDENYILGLKHMMASDIRVLERDINSPQDALALGRTVGTVEKKWEDIFYHVILSREMAELSAGAKDIGYLEKTLQASAWEAVMAFHDISHYLAEWPRHWSKYYDDFNREKKYVFDKIKRTARKAYSDALILTQARTEQAKTFDFGERVTVGNFILIPEAGIQEDKMRDAAELMKRVQSLIGKAGFNNVLSRMIINVTAQSKTGLVGGEYSPEKDSMNILPIGMSVQVIVHELGHRNWYRVLTSGDREYWKAAFEGDLTEITKADVEDIIERARKPWQEEGSLGGAIRGAVAAYVVNHKEDPVVPYKANYFLDNVHVHDNFDFWAETWRKDLVGQKVMKNFVTDYADTNEKEAYAEVFMYYVMKKSLPSVVLHWFRQVSL